MNGFKLLVFGDIVGSIGRKALTRVLPQWREEHAPDMVIANVENLSHGRGITPKALLELDAAGVDFYTSGNHVWENETGLACFRDPRWAGRLIRPGNYRPELPGTGHAVWRKGEVEIAVLNLMGRLFMREEVADPFAYFDEVAAMYQKIPLIVDFHTEATSEKEAFGHYVDGRAAAVLGTHTHVPTADAKVLPGGTAYVTDVGRTGGHDSVVGFEKGAAVKRFLGSEEKAYDPQPKGQAEANAMLVKLDLDKGSSASIERLREILEI